MKTKTVVFSFVFCAGLLAITAPRAYADTHITFQVDMTYQIQDGSFTNGVNTVYALGTFNNWGNSPYTSLQLTNNPAAANTNLYTGTIDDTVDTNGAQLQWKFTTSNLSFETTQEYNDNRVTLLPTINGSSLVLPVAFFSDAAYTVNPVANNATFQVDMAQQIALGNFNPNTMNVEVQGGFNAWAAGSTLTNDPSILRTNQFGLVSSNVYLGTILIPGSPGQIQEFQYVIQPAGLYESPNSLNGEAGNHLGLHRFCFEGQDFVSSQTLPIVFFSDAPYAPVVTNNVVFSVDMTAPTLSGFFKSSSNTVTLRGGFNNWNTTSTVCTNNPNGGNTNIYSVVISNMISGAGGIVTQFKFGFNPNTVNSSYENNPNHTYAGPPVVFPTGGNRAFDMPNVNNSTVVLPTVYYSDLSPSTVLPAPTVVTFSVNMTNAVGTDAHVFNPGTDSVYLNGLDTTNSLGNYSFDAWTNAPTGPTWTNAIANFLMQNNPVGSQIYSIQVTIPAGYPVQLSYLYSINGTVNEPPGGGINHTNYIRSTGNYVLPLDKFGTMVGVPSFGNLAIGSKSGGNVPITWLGRPGVHLQTRPSLTSGAWLDVSGTDAQSSTNYPVGSDASYFRLINPF